MQITKVIKVGSSSGIVLTKDVLTLLGIERGAQVFLTAAPDNAIRISPYDPETAEAFEEAERIMTEDRDMLKALSG